MLSAQLGRLLTPSMRNVTTALIALFVPSQFIFRAIVSLYRVIAVCSYSYNVVVVRYFLRYRVDFANEFTSAQFYILYIIFYLYKAKVVTD